MSQGQAVIDASLVVTYGTKWGRSQDVRTSSGDVLLEMCSGRNFPEWTGAYSVTKRKPQKSSHSEAVEILSPGA